VKTETKFPEGNKRENPDGRGAGRDSFNRTHNSTNHEEKRRICRTLLKLRTSPQQMEVMRVDRQSPMSEDVFLQQISDKDHCPEQVMSSSHKQKADVQ
jgi:hypothetical protein